MMFEICCDFNERKLTGLMMYKMNCIKMEMAIIIMIWVKNDVNNDDDDDSSHEWSYKWRQLWC